MAPREATGTFPDQFLTFDYDLSGPPLGIPPLHDHHEEDDNDNNDLRPDPPPPANTTTATTAHNNNNNITNARRGFVLANHHTNDIPALPDVNDVPGLPGLDEETFLLSPNDGAAGEVAGPSSGDSYSAAAAAVTSVVDPLSIDPTATTTTAMTLSRQDRSPLLSTPLDANPLFFQQHSTTTNRRSRRSIRNSSHSRDVNQGDSVGSPSVRVVDRRGSQVPPPFPLLRSALPLHQPSPSWLLQQQQQHSRRRLIDPVSPLPDPDYSMNEEDISNSQHLNSFDDDEDDEDVLDISLAVPGSPAATVTSYSTAFLSVAGSIQANSNHGISDSNHCGGNTDNNSDSDLVSNSDSENDSSVEILRIIYRNRAFEDGESVPLATAPGAGVATSPAPASTTSSSSSSSTLPITPRRVLQTPPRLAHNDSILMDEDSDDEDDENEDDENENGAHAPQLHHLSSTCPRSPPRRHSIPNASSSSSSNPASPSSSTSLITFAFGPTTTVTDLQYFAERGCIVPLLQALTTPHLVTIGTRLLADYAKMSHRRVAVASNKRILEFLQRTMLLQVGEIAGARETGGTGNGTQHPAHNNHGSHTSSAGTSAALSLPTSILHYSNNNNSNNNGNHSNIHNAAARDWLGREYAVETIRSLTATEESDRYLMNTYGLLPTLALLACGGPICQGNIPLASDKARLHACIAIMNLSCGKANKIEIAQIPEVLEAMREVMLHSNDEARLKATTCIKNLSNADANDAALLGTPGLVEALGHVAATTCSRATGGATPCTTHACLALMNLSIAKHNKQQVYRTRGVMAALMQVLDQTTGLPYSAEARVKACSALSNLAIGYDNKIPMFHWPGFVESILSVIHNDTGEARTKACSILWSFAAEIKNQVPVVQRGDILPMLVRVADEDGTAEARFKCVAALTLLAESLDNALPLLRAGALHPLMDILHEAGPDPTQWKGQTASWCVGFLMNLAQSDQAVPVLRDAGVVELLAPLLTLDHYQSLKAAMAVTFCCRFDAGDECYDLLRKTENVIPKIISLLHNTLSGRGGNGYKYGVFTLRSSVGCISALALGPEFMKERIATGPVFESLLRVVTDFCVDGGTAGAIVGGGRDDPLSATLAVRALQSLTGHLIPIAGSSTLPFGQGMDERLLIAFEAFEKCHQREIRDETRQLATDARIRIEGGRRASAAGQAGIHPGCNIVHESDGDEFADVASMASHCCGGFEAFPSLAEGFLLNTLTLPSQLQGYPAPPPPPPPILASSSVVEDDMEERPVRTFLLTDHKTGRRFVVPVDPSGGRAFNDSRIWCYRRGRFCLPNEEPDPDYQWTAELQQAYEEVLVSSIESTPSPTSVMIEGWSKH